MHSRCSCSIIGILSSLTYLHNNNNNNNNNAKAQSLCQHTTLQRDTDKWRLNSTHPNSTHQIYTRNKFSRSAFCMLGAKILNSNRIGELPRVGTGAVEKVPPPHLHQDLKSSLLLGHHHHHHHQSSSLSSYAVGEDCRFQQCTKEGVSQNMN